MSDISGDLPSDEDLFVRAVERSQELIESGRCVDAEEAMEEVFALAMKIAEQDDSPDWQLVVEASDHEAALNYTMAWRQPISSGLRCQTEMNTLGTRIVTWQVSTSS